MERPWHEAAAAVPHDDSSAELLNRPAPAAQPVLTADVEVACAVCGSSELTTMASAREMATEHAWLRRFHQQRVHRASAGPRQAGNSPSDTNLEERSEFTQNYATDVVVCTSCRLVFRNPRPSTRAIAAAYAADTYGSQRLATLFEWQCELFRPKAAMLERWRTGRNPRLVIEVGSFVGGFLAAARELGWDAIGIDPGEEVASFCRSKGLTVLRDEFAQCELPRSAVDCIAIWSTFDQLPSPHPTLTAVRRLLRPGGILVLRVPNGACFELAHGSTRRWPAPAAAVLRAGMAWNNLLGFPYLYGYSVATLDRLLAGYGFERVMFLPDVLTRLADEQSKPWAIWEERVLKALWKVASRADVFKPRGSRIAPWFDAYYRQRD